MRRLCCGLLLASMSMPLAAQYATPRATAAFPSGLRLSLEIADTERTRQRGLMYRKTMAPTEGMIFVFEERGFYPFWMKNTLIPLDLFWLERDGTIVSIQHAIPPCGNVSDLDNDCPTWAPARGTGAVYVIETVAGLARKHDVKVGQRIVLTGMPATR